MERVSWSYFNKYDDVIDEYLPVRGEGDDAGIQAVVAVNKLIYKWYNDGDVFDNQHGLTGWANDLSSYANWLHKYTDTDKILERIFSITTKAEYDHLLVDLAEAILNENAIQTLRSKYDDKTISSIYDCDGPFAFTLNDDYDEDDWEEEEGDESYE